MNQAAVVDLNSRSALEKCVAAGTLTWSGPLTVPVARFALSWLVYGGIGALYTLLGVAKAWQTAAGWWTV